MLNAVDNVNLQIERREIFGLAGESGCGKTMTAYSILQLVPNPGKIVAGEIIFNGSNLLDLREKDLRKKRGKEISLVFQEPSTVLNPCFKIGNQIMEALLEHNDISTREARGKSVEMLTQVDIPDPDEVMRRYPHQLSGGMKQRVAIAMALIGEPKLLIADEPTTALDVTIQAQVLSIIKRSVVDRDMAVLYITHDLGVLRWICHRAAVMYAGQIVEVGPVADLIADPLHPYTRGLVKATPKMAGDKLPLETIKGRVPTLADLPKGCNFSPRCPRALPRCLEEKPEEAFVKGRSVRCFTY